MNETADLSTFAPATQAPNAGPRPGRKSLRKFAQQAPVAPAPPPRRDRLTRAQMLRLFTAWRRDCQIAQHSERTLDSCRKVFDKLIWFLDLRGHGSCGSEELRDFFAYVTTAHTDVQNGAGRWGVSVASRPSTGRALKPLTVKTYFGRVRAFLNWVVEQHELDASPMDEIKLPANRPDQIQPFAQPQVDALLAAARHGPHPRRDEAVVLLLLDTGLRVSELCALKARDVDTTMKSLRVEGKGGKERSLYFGRTTARALWAYRQEERKGVSDALFTADRGELAGMGLTDSGVRQLLERLGRAAGVEGVRCSPHTFRHTFAVSFLRAGGNTFSLQQLMGHTTVTQTMKYVKLVEADLEHQHRLYSPVDRMKRR